MAYIGQSIKNGTFSVLDTSGNTYNGSNTTFNLGTQVGSPAQLLVSHDGVIQLPGTDYTLATGGTQITFTTAPASGASIFIVEISGAVGGPINSDLNGNELVLDVDGDTSITADTDDQIDIKIGGADDFAFKANKFEVQTGSNIDMNGTELILDADGDTSITADTDDQIDFKVGGSDKFTMTTDTFTARNNLHLISASGTSDLRIQNSTTGSGSTDGLLIQATGSDVYINQYESAPIYFRTANTDRMQIDASGNLLIGTTNTNVTGSSSTQGINLKATGRLQASVAGDSVIFNRNSDDGELVRFHQAGNVEGTITVSGTTVSYNGFTGTHWSRLADNSKPTILKGTILESLDAMVDWYYVEFTYGEDKDTQKESYTLGEGENVGDTITYKYEGKDYQAVIKKEGDVKHTQSKVSDTADAKNVYGVFMAWDNDDDTVNDMYVAQTGTFVIRIHKDETVSKGDLIQSKGDGTGKVQADDIMRASTVAKVLSTTKIETYSDGSYIIPCSLHC